MSESVSSSVVLASLNSDSGAKTSNQFSDLSSDTLELNTEWSLVLKKAFRNPFELLKYLEIDDQKYVDQVDINNRFKMLVPLSYAGKMKKGDWNDPLLMQVLPLKHENTTVTGFESDPVGDLHSEISPGVLHKYQGRVLLVTTGACPVHCRYCFRREYPYTDSVPDRKYWQDTLDKIRKDNSIHEVILSGGDPLMLSDKRLQNMCKEIEAIDHVTTIRFHSRVPLFLPERITSECLQWLKNLKLNKVLVIHSNHKNEIDVSVGNVLTALRASGVTVLNQSVLLRGINDSIETLCDLSQRLFKYQVLPYYIHQLDRVNGSAHFEVEINAAIQLIEELKGQLPGYLVPKFVKEVSGKRSKQTIVKIDK